MSDPRLPQGYQSIRLQESEQVFRITLCRPEQRNSLTQKVVDELRSALDYCESHARCRVILLCGQEGVFCTGMDLETMVPSATGHGPERIRSESFMDLLKRLDQSRRVIIAEVDGVVLAGGVGLVAVSDLAIATPRSSFALSEALWGLLPAMVAPFLIRRIGFHKAYSMTLTTQPVPAEEALRIGLIDAVSEHPADEIRMRCYRLTRLDPQTVSDLKAYFRKMWLLNEAMERTAVAEFERLADSPRVRGNIQDYVQLGRFPWERHETE